MPRYNVLVVDDEHDFREVVVKKLEKRDLHCGSAGEGKIALEMIKAKAYDVVLLDVKMPGMDGIETLREIKKIAPMTEVVMLTGHASVESGINGIKYGAFDYLMKPVDLKALLEKIEQAYKKRITEKGRS